MSASQTTKRRRISVVTRERVSPAGPAASILLHAAIIAAFLFTWQHKLDITDETPPLVPVDLITVGEKTNVQAMDKATPAPEPKQETPPPPPTQLPMPAPEQAEAAPDIAPTKTVIPKAAPDQTVAPHARPDQPSDTKNNFDALLNTLTAPDKSQAKVKTGTRTIAGIGAQSGMTADLVDALRSQIAQCWSPPTGAPNPQDLVVDFDLVLNPDGTIAQPPQSAAAQSRNPYTRAAAEAARRAIYSCEPYKLPADRYSQWREINPFRFDPRQMQNQ